MNARTRSSELTISGIPASPGIVIGQAFVFGDILDEVEETSIPPERVDAEIERFREAVRLVREELNADAARVSQRLGQDEAAVFLVHSMILEDRQVLEGIEGKVRRDLVNAESAVASEMKRVSGALASSDDSYLRERAFDITDIGKRVIERMLGVWAHCPLSQPMVVVARELRASDTVSMDQGRILGFVTELGGKETHAAILARSLGVPAIVGVSGAVSRIRAGDAIIVDGDAGAVIVGPTEATLEVYRSRRAEEERERAELTPLLDVSSETSDGLEVRLMANIGSVEEARRAVDMGADGVGLFRTELLFMAARLFLSEDEQFEIYSEVARMMGDRPVTIRTLDIGGDKFVGDENPLREHNPYLGYRSIRLLLDRPELFTAQMRAILRAGLHGNVRILWPMISTVGELRAAKALLDEARESLRREAIPFSEDVPVGVMIEIPSAALVADRLAAECDFLSIGTNDLVQYTLAVDRGNVLVDHLYRAHDPAVLSLIRRTVEGAGASGKPVALCGEMGGIPCYVPLLIGLGLRELSVVPGRLLSTKKAVRSTATRDAERLAEAALSASTAEEVARTLGWVATAPPPECV